jgi:hypothetical protein
MKERKGEEGVGEGWGGSCLFVRVCVSWVPFSKIKRLELRVKKEEWKLK